MKRMEETRLVVSFGEAGVGYFHSSGAFTLTQDNVFVEFDAEDAHDIAHIIQHGQQRQEAA